MPSPERVVKPETNAVWMPTTDTAATARSPSKQGKCRGRPAASSAPASRAPVSRACASCVATATATALGGGSARQHGGAPPRAPPRRGRRRSLLVVLRLHVDRPDVVVGSAHDVLD